MSRPPKPPADPFEWSAWLRARDLRACSYAARGLWFDMLCVMAEAEPKGYLLIAGRACDATVIARVTGGSEEEIAPLLAELERNGVFSRLDNGTIYCRRMVRDARRSGTASQHGKRGGPRPELPLKLPGFEPKTLQGLEGETAPKPPLSLDSKLDSESELRRKESKEDSNLKPRASGPHRLPDDWSITTADRQYAVSKGFRPDEIATLAEHFANHHWKKGTKWERWDSAWKTWVLNEIKFSRRNEPGNPRSAPPGGTSKITPADLASGRFRRSH